jgi:hypothetical protein
MSRPSFLPAATSRTSPARGLAAELAAAGGGGGWAAGCGSSWAPDWAPGCGGTGAAAAGGVTVGVPQCASSAAGAGSSAAGTGSSAAAAGSSAATAVAAILGGDPDGDPSEPESRASRDPVSRRGRAVLEVRSSRSASMRARASLLASPAALNLQPATTLRVARCQAQAPAGLLRGVAASAAPPAARAGGRTSCDVLDP